MNTILVRRFVRRLLPVLPFIVALFAFRIYQDVKQGRPVAEVILLNGIPLLLVVFLFTGMLWYLSRRVPGLADTEAAIEVRRQRMARGAALASTVVSVLGTLGLIASYLWR